MVSSSHAQGGWHSIVLGDIIYKISAFGGKERYCYYDDTVMLAYRDTATNPKHGSNWCEMFDWILELRERLGT